MHCSSYMERRPKNIDASYQAAMLGLFQTRECRLHHGDIHWTEVAGEVTMVYVLWDSLNRDTNTIRLAVERNRRDASIEMIRSREGEGAER